MSKWPKLKGVETDRSPKVTPEVISVNYDLWTLRITLLFTDDKNPTYVDFGAIAGFRVLDEGQLLEFWGPDTENHWLFTVESKGWLAMEASRETAPFITEDGKLTEYLVAGINECVSIISYGEPTIFTVK